MLFRSQEEPSAPNFCCGGPAGPGSITMDCDPDTVEEQDVSLSNVEEMDISVKMLSVAVKLCPFEDNQSNNITAEAAPKRAAIKYVFFIRNKAN